jgi:hypothetical protein
VRCLYLLGVSLEELKKIAKNPNQDSWPLGRVSQSQVWEFWTEVLCVEHNSGLEMIIKTVAMRVVYACLKLLAISSRFTSSE